MKWQALCNPLCVLALLVSKWPEVAVDRRGDDFEEYARAQQQRLFQTAYLLCGNRDAAQDLVQTTLVKMFVSWRRARQADDLNAYVRAVLTRCFFDQQRKSRRERRAHELLDPPVGVDRPEVRVTLLAALAQLPPRQRATLVLRYWEDLSVEATAAAMGCRPGTVKSQSARALIRLRVLLGDSLRDRETL